MKNTGTVLVVDNNEAVGAFIELALQDHGFTVFVANSGWKAINLFRVKPIDIVLMDIKLRRMTGPETLMILQVIRPDVVCFLMTASGSPPNEHLAGAIDVFEKPFRNFSEVVRIFAEIVDKRGTIKHPARFPNESYLEKKSSKTRNAI